MSSPFPGMDPYLEKPSLWQQVHTALIVEIQYFLSPLLRPRSYVAIPVIAELPQPEEVRRRYLEIRDTQTQAVITALEILSPSNKMEREGREQYEHKRLKILGSMTHLVEIDLLRAGEPMPMKTPYQNDYRIVVSRSQQRPQAEVYLFSVRHPIPDFPIPLRPGEEEPVLPLNQLLHDLYDKSSYDLIVDYRQPPIPSLSVDDTQWAAELSSST